MQKNVGIWLRVSTDMQVKDESPEIHEKRARLYAEAKGWNVVTIYRLDALSGKSIMDYTETKRMLDDINNGVITGIIFSKLARLARNTKELLEISEVFRNCEADLISLAESIDTSTPAGRLFFTVIAAMAQWEREEIADRVSKSVPIRAKLGRPLGGQAVFGYEWNNGDFKINPQEAEIRKLIYEVFLRTRRKKSTAKEINNMGFRTRNGSMFTTTTIDRLIKDTTAKGIRRANYSRSLGEGKHWELKPKEDWIEIPCEAIIEEDLWERCNEIINQSTSKRKKSQSKKTVHLLSGYVYCSCGLKMYVYHQDNTFKCKQCKRKIQSKDIDEIYHEQLKVFLLSETDFAAMQSKTGEVINSKLNLLSDLENTYSNLRKKLEKQLELRMSGELSKEDFKVFYDPINSRLREIENQIPELQAEIDFLRIKALSSETILEDAYDLYNSWEKLTFEEKRTIVESITDKIEIAEETIDIEFSYLPAPLSSFQNTGNSSHNLRDSY